MAYDINDWEVTTISNIKIAPIKNDNQRIIDVTNVNETIEVTKKGLNSTATLLGYFDGSDYIHYFSSDGDAQIKWNVFEHQVVKDTKYNINLARQNKTVEIDYRLSLSSADNPNFKLYDISDNLIATLNLINAGNTNTVTGFLRFKKIPNGTIITAVYTYIKNGTPYHENQSAFFTTTPAKVAFGADSGYTFDSNSYAIITNK